MFMISGRFKFKGKFIGPWFILWVFFTCLSGTQPAPAIAATWLLLSTTVSLCVRSHSQLWRVICIKIKHYLKLLGKLQDAFATVSKQATSATKDTNRSPAWSAFQFVIFRPVSLQVHNVMLPNKSACDLTFNWCMNMESNRSVQGYYSLLLRCTFCECCAAVVVVYYAVLPAAKACSINQRFRCL